MYNLENLLKCGFSTMLFIALIVTIHENPRHLSFRFIQGILVFLLQFSSTGHFKMTPKFDYQRCPEGSDFPKEWVSLTFPWFSSVFLVRMIQASDVHQQTFSLKARVFLSHLGKCGPVTSEETFARPKKIQEPPTPSTRNGHLICERLRL